MNPLGNTQPIAAQPSNAFNTPIKQTKQIQEISPIFSESPSKPKTKIADFEICGFVGEGAYAKVYLVKHKVTSKMYAAKVIDKDNVRLVISLLRKETMHKLEQKE
jgi:serine/threonine protein kinase